MKYIICGYVLAAALFASVIGDVARIIVTQQQISEARELTARVEALSKQ